jgi:hypothetical protein
LDKPFPFRIREEFLRVLNSFLFPDFASTDILHHFFRLNVLKTSDNGISPFS